ncbi:acetyl-CoA carboxylase biotin carboxyl carrier protein subunit [Propionibacterium freudenreichii]|nr:acetyl-CoA carboxylase biotin carboxyl carrier protein subunit [Propionibacterium freudenreichii]CEG87383.1 Putative uncharacterized protein [Propionibacterium freudenreichii]
MSHYRDFLTANATSIGDFRERQQRAFQEEEQRWRDSGEFDRATEPATAPAPVVEDVEDGQTAVRAPFMANVWKVDVRPGQLVGDGEQLVSLEAMKMESSIAAPGAGTVRRIFVEPGAQVSAGQVLMTIEDAA